MRQYTEAQRWAQPQAVKGHAWSPTIAVSYDLTDRHRLFVRYAQATRFPSIYEVGGLYNDISHISHPTAPNFHLKPEKSRSWEVGWNYNFAPRWHKLRQGDVRLTYYHNTIRNLIDTVDFFRISQYDRKISSGLELQSRWDSGRFFGSFGASYRLKQKVCDRDTQFMYDPYGNQGMPLCLDNGVGNTKSYRNIQPKYSLSLEGGTRLLGEKLELGVRGTYHSKVDTKQYDRLMSMNRFGRAMRSNGQPYYWRPALVWDLYGRYQLNKHIDLNVGITNLTNRYYLDPMSNVAAPGPGRTVTLGIQGKF